ncbi:sugar ABC transporter substrate-binding protein [Bifidobacterium myosotis]|nr:maltose ABC transporter substrate-binding protein [Bifidobacterium myosotis]
MNMHTNRGIFRSIGAVSVALIALAGCGNPGDVTATQQDQGEATSSTLTIWADADRVSVLKDVAEQFTDKTGVKVNLVQKDMGSVQQDLITQVPAGKGPDIAIGQNDWTGILATDGVIQPLELGDAESDYEKVATDAFNYNGKIYALPYAIENVALVRNTKLAPQAPTTWDDMVATAKSVGAEYPYLLQVGDQGDSYTMYPIQTSFGSFVFGQRDDGSYDSSKLTIGDENGVKFAQWVQQQAQNGTLSTSMSADISLSKFEQGASPYFITGPWNISAIQKAGIDVAVDPIPSAGGQTAKPFVGVSGFFLSSKTTNKIAATDFLINYIGTADVQQSLYKVGQRLPALTAAYDQASKDSIAQGFGKASENGVPMPNITEMSSVWQYWNATEVSIISQRGDPAELWSQMTDEIQSALNK